MLQSQGVLRYLIKCELTFTTLVTAVTRYPKISDLMWVNFHNTCNISHKILEEIYLDYSSCKSFNYIAAMMQSQDIKAFTIVAVTRYQKKS